MKKFACLFLLLVLSLLLGSCALHAAIKEQPLLTEVDPPAMQIANPWQDYASLVEAMEAAGVVSAMGSNGGREVLAPPPVGH